MTFLRRVKDRWKRGTFFFKMPFRLSRYDFRFSRYRRAKGKVIFRRFFRVSPLARVIANFFRHDGRREETSRTRSIHNKTQE